MKKTMKILVALSVVCSLAILQACKKHHDPNPLNLATITANDVDLNGATAPSNVAVDAVITITFSTNVDPTTVTTSNITMTRDFDQADVALTLATSGKTVTVTPTSALNPGALYVLALKEGLKSTDGLAFVPLTRSFTTIGTFQPDGVIAHWTFENSTNDVAGTFNADAGLTKDVTYVDSRNATAGKAAAFNGTSTIIEIPNGDQFLSHTNFSLSFWVYADTTKHGQFVMGLAAWKGFQFEIAGDYTWCKLAEQYDEGGGFSDSEDNWFPGNGQTKDNGGWQGWTFQKDVTASGGVGATYFDVKWANVVCTYDAATKLATMYINGEKVKQHDFNLWPDGDKKQGIVGVKFAGNTNGNKFAIGFIQGSENRVITDSWADPSDPANNHFKGKLDDIRIYSRAVTAQEVTLMYNSEK